MPIQEPTASSTTLDETLRHIQELMKQSRFGEALSETLALAAEVPDDRDVLYMTAVNQRYLGQIDDALATLDRLETFHGRYSRLYQERGHCFVARKDATPAIEAYLKAVNINPALPGSWNKLQHLFRMVGQFENAGMAAEHVATLAKLPPEVVTATALFEDGDVTLAEKLIREFLLRCGDHVEAIRLLARIGLEHDVLDDAAALLEGVLAKAPGYHAARYDYARTLLRAHRHLKALAELNKLIEVEPTNRAYRATYATTIVGLGDHEKGLRLYQDLLRESPDDPHLLLSVGHSLKTLGRTAEAITAYRQAIAKLPHFGEAYWSMANLKTYRFTPEEIAQMREQEAAPAIRPVDRYHLCFALAKALEDRGDFGDSFSYYERGNALKKSESHYQPEIIEKSAQIQSQVCTAAFFAAHHGIGCLDPDPIFIVGLPRSGSTLIEQILASHSQVEGTMELANISHIVQELQSWETNVDDSNRRCYPQLLDQMSADIFKGLGERYIKDTRVYRTSKPFFIDKMPNNFWHLGLIHLMLPNAKIIDARREPMACCFSNFKQLFATGQEFTYSIEDIARYYRSYVELMDHWDQALPGRILRVHHEEVVENLEGTVRQLLDFCGLPFEGACLEFHKTTRSVRTASSEQVRQPIFKEGLSHWRHFERWLGPLKLALGPLVGS